MKPSSLIVLLVVLAALTGCQKGTNIPGLRELSELSGLAPSDEERIAAVLDDVHRGIEKAKIYKVLAHVSRQYHDEEGRDYAALEAHLNRLFKEYRVITITRVVPDIAVQGNRARAVETFGTRAEPANPKVDAPIDLQGQVTVYFEKTGGQWQIVEWGRML